MMTFAMHEKGLYLLLLEVHGLLQVGKLGTLLFDGWYVYVGSAQGPGGLKRLQRHFDYRQRSHPPMRWHVDALLAAGALRDAIVGVTTDRLECGLADAVSETLTPAFKGFGSSDCGCATHLFSAASAGEAREASWRAVVSLGLPPLQVG